MLYKLYLPSFLHIFYIMSVFDFFLFGYSCFLIGSLVYFFVPSFPPRLQPTPCNVPHPVVYSCYLCYLRSFFVHLFLSLQPHLGSMLRRYVWLDSPLAGSQPRQNYPWFWKARWFWATCYPSFRALSPQLSIFFEYLIPASAPPPPSPPLLFSSVLCFL